MNFREILHRSGGSPTRRFLHGSPMLTYPRAPEELGAHIQHGSGVFIFRIPPLIQNTPLVYYNLRPVGRRKFRCFPCTFKTIFNVSRAFWERCKTVFDKKISFWSLEFLKIFACGALTGSILQWYKRPLSLVNSTTLFRTCTSFQSVYYVSTLLVITKYLLC